MEVYRPDLPQPIKLEDNKEYGGFLLPTAEERLTALEEKLDRLLARLEPRTNEISTSGANKVFTLTVENRHSPEAAPFSAWIYWLSKTIVVKASGAQDVGPMVRGIVGWFGVVKGLMITDSQYGQSADAAVEFTGHVTGGHTCNGLCLPTRGLWFGTNNIEIT